MDKKKAFGVWYRNISAIVAIDRLFHTTPSLSYSDSDIHVRPKFIT